MFTAFIFPVKADDEDQMIFEANEDLYSILETSPGAFETSQLKNFKLRDSDIPLSMQDTDIKDSNAVVRLKTMEKDLSSIVYLNIDGTLSAYMFGENIKYISEEKALDKTNILKYDIENRVYYNPDNDIKIELPLSLSEKAPISVTFEDFNVSFAPIIFDNEIASKKCFKSDKENYIEYDNAFNEGTKLVYSPMFSGIKEDIIISSPGNITDFEYRIYTNGLKAIQTDDVVNLVDKNGIIIAYINQLEIFDSEGNPGGGRINLEELVDSKEYRYSIHVDDAFINDENTVYPITVDPVFTYATTTKIKDVQVNQNSTTVNQSASTACIGYNTSTLGISRFFVKFPSLQSFLGTLTSLNQICEVKYNFYCSNAATTNNTLYYFYPCTLYWDPNSSTVSSLLYNSYSTSYPGIVYITAAGSYSVDLTYMFRYFGETSTFEGFVMKKYAETDACYAIINTINNTSNKPYLTIHYSEELPTSETSNITNKSVYRIKNDYANKYLTKNATVSGTTVNMTFGLEVSNTAFGSTREKSQFVSVNYVGGGKYTLSFLMPPTSTSPTDTTTGYSTNYYLKATFSSSGATLGFSTNTAISSTKWYIIYNSPTNSYKIINASKPSYYLSASSSSLTVTEYILDEHYWNFEYCGYDVPVYMQGHQDSCGWACVCMILRFYNIYATEDEVIAGRSETSNYNLMASTLNNYLNNDTPLYIGNNELIQYEYNESGFLSKLNSYLANRPISLLCKYSNTSQMGWGTNTGHYIVLKGIADINGNKKCLINDCYYNNCRERVIDLSELHSYSNAKYGYSVHP